MIRPAPPFILNAFLEAGEGREHEVYPDSNGTLTIGIGHTGLDVQPGLVWTDAQIDAQRDKDVAKAIRRLEKVLKPAVILALTDHQWAALISFAFNLGADPAWTIWKVLNAQAEGWEDETCVQLGRFINETDQATGKKRVVKGLKARRAAEVALFLTDDGDVTAPLALAAAAPMAPSSATLRDAPTPPTPAASSPQRLAKRPSFLTGIGGLVLGAPALLSVILDNFLKPVMDAITPFVGQSEHVGKVVGILATVAAVLVALNVILTNLEARRERN